MLKSRMLLKLSSESYTKDLSIPLTVARTRPAPSGCPGARVPRSLNAVGLRALSSCHLGYATPRTLRKPAERSLARQGAFQGLSRPTTPPPT